MAGITDISGIINMIVPLLSGLIQSVSGYAMQIGTMIFPQSPGLALVVISFVVAFLLKDKLSGGMMYVLLALMLFLVLSGGIKI
jgi:hypothetical protein